MKRAKQRAAFLALLLFSGCSPAQKALPGTQALWESQLGWNRATRKIAESAPRCLKDRVADPRSLREEVAQLEPTAGATAVTGNWEGIDLSTLPGPQAQFLKANAHWIANDEVNFSGCKDLPCIINLVYGAKATEPGWRAYYYYLATGYSISMRDYVPVSGGLWRDDPDQVVFDAPRSAHLFSESELGSFRKLATLLPESYRFVGAQRFHRVPSGPQVPDANWCKSGRIDTDGICVCPGGVANQNKDGTCNAFVKKEYCIPESENRDGSCRITKSGTCADSWGGKSKGIVRVKECIQEDNFSKRYHFYPGDDVSLSDNGIRGQFYITITHELTHNWDRSLASALRPDGSLLLYSDSHEWRALSGWHEEPVVVPPEREGAGVSGLASYLLVPALSGDGFVKDYARTNPEEDLAETAAWVRFRPTLVSQRSPRKTEFLSKKIFGGRTFDPSGLSGYYVDFAFKEISPQLLEVVQGCLARAQAPSAGTAGAAIVGAVHLTLDSPLPESLVACIESELHNRTTVAFDALRGTEWEACDVFAEKEAELRSRVFGRLSADVTLLVSKSSESKPAFQAISELRAAIAAKVDPREAYVHCFLQSQAEACYQQAVEGALDRVAQPFVAQLGDQLEVEKTSYLLQHPFEQSQSNSRRFYSQVLAGIEPHVSATAETRWQACMGDTASSSADTLHVTPYSGGAHYVSGRILKCINTAYDADLRVVRDAYLSRIGLNVKDTDVQSLIQELLLPTYLESLKGKQDLAAAAEDLARDRRKSGVVDVIAADLVRNQAWLKGAAAQDAASAQCVQVAAGAFDSYFARVSADEQLSTRFVAIEDIRAAWALEACTRVIALPSVAHELQLRVSEAWKKALAALDHAVSERSRDKATDCIARHPSRGSRVSESIHAHRNRCLVAKQTWNMIESQALVDWGHSNDGRGFAFTRRKDAIAYMDERRQAAQSVATKAMRARK